MSSLLPHYNRITSQYPVSAFDPADMSLITGWADYSDTQYTVGSPFAVVADTDTILPNNGLGGPKTQEPDGETLYSAGKITGRNGDGILITVDMM